MQVVDHGETGVFRRQILLEFFSRFRGQFLNATMSWMIGLASLGLTTTSAIAPTCWRSSSPAYCSGPRRYSSARIAATKPRERTRQKNLGACGLVGHGDIGHGVNDRGTESMGTTSPYKATTSRPRNVQRRTRSLPVRRAGPGIDRSILEPLVTWHYSCRRYTRSPRRTVGRTNYIVQSSKMQSRLGDENIGSRMCDRLNTERRRAVRLQARKNR